MNKKIEDLKEEHDAYLKVMDGYKTLEPCLHQKQTKTQTAFKPLEGSNLEIAEVICLECQQFIGFVYRKKKTIPQEKTTAKFIVYAKDKNSYTTKPKEGLKP